MLARKSLGNCALVAFLLTAVAAAYYPLAHAGWLLWDDASYVYRNPLVVDTDWPGQLRGAFTSIQCSNYHPLTMLSHVLVWRLAGDRPLAHHLVNVALHLLNGLLVYTLLRLLSITRPVAAALSALFLIHPANVPAVAWIAERKEVLATALYLTSACSWLAAQSAADKKHTWVTLAVFSGGGALLAKPTAVTLPAILLLLAWFRRGRLELSAILAVGPLALGAVALAGATIAAQSTTAVQDVPWSQRVPLVLHTGAWYVIHWLLPVGLSPHHPRYVHWLSWDGHAIGGLAVVVALATVAIASVRRMRGVTLGVAWFLIGWLPVSGVIPVGKAAVADRYLYLPQVGLLIALGTLVMNLGLRRVLGPVARYALVCGAAAVLVCAAVATADYCRAWQNDRTLWQWVLDRYPDSGLAWLNLGAYYAQVERDVTRARRFFERARQTETDQQQKLAQLNLLLLDLARRPDDPGLLLALDRLLELPPAADNRLVRRAIRDARAAAARRAIARGMSHAALRHCGRALAVAPGDPEVRYLQALAYAAGGQTGQAVQTWQALVEDPDSPAAVRRLAAERLRELR